MRRLDFDVLVIGGGGAGLRAAMAAHQAGARVAVMAKGPIRHSSTTICAVLSYCCATGRDDSPQTHLKDTLVSGRGLNDATLAGLLCREASPRLTDLLQIGARFEFEESSKDLKRVILPGHSKARASFWDRSTGKEMVRALGTWLVNHGVPFFEYVFALDLCLAADSAERAGKARMRGVVALDLRAGELLVFQAPAVIVATGGGGECFWFNTMPPSATGDGYGLCWRAGAPFVDMEFVQMYPSVLVAPEGVRGVELTTGEAMLRQGLKLLDETGKPFFDAAAAGERGRITRDMLARMIGERTARGCPVYVDMTHDQRPKALDAHFAYLKALGVEPYAKPIQVAPAAHYFMGGVRIEPDTSTGIEGLFAAGEVAGGIQGANRLAGNALPETQVFGAIAGEQAARYAAASGTTTVAEADIAAAERLLRAIYDGYGRSSEKPALLRERIQKLMHQYASIPRTGEGLTHLVQELEAISASFATSFSLTDSGRRFNQEVLNLLELRNIVVTALLIAQAARERRETRGAHVREDFPQENPALRLHYLLSRSETGETKITAEPVR